MNIIIFSNLFPNKLEPERGNFIALMVSKLAKIAKAQVISPLPWFPNLSLLKKIPLLWQWAIFSEIPYKDNYKNIQVHYPKYFFLPKIGFIFQPITIIISTYYQLRKIKKDNNVDIINAHWIFPDAVSAVYISRLLRIPCVVSARGCDINKYSASYFRRKLINWTLHNSDHITVVSNALKESIINIYNIDKNKITIIPNGVDESIFHLMDQDTCRNALDLTLKSKILLFVGQLHPVKNIATMLKALAIIKNNKKLIFNTIIIGAGPLEFELKKLASDLGLTSSEVDFKGQQTHTDVATYFGAADLLCLPSLREGRPNVVIEALATGLPVVASNVGGIPELINSSNGALVSPSDEIELAKAISVSMDKNWDRSEIASTQSASSWDSCAKQYLDLFTKVLKLIKR